MNTYFDADFDRGWPVLRDDWKAIFGKDYKSKKGHTMWMVASDGSRLSGPYGIRCWKGTCEEGNYGNFVGQYIKSWGSSHIGTPVAFKDLGIPECEQCCRENVRPDWCNTQACRPCDAFHDGFKYINASTGQELGLLDAVLYPAVGSCIGFDQCKSRWTLPDAVSCSKYYAPELNLQP